ncbi:GNAT family N-acetyltransferase [Mycoplasmopsis canis]|uniref:GNAT family N-acetyltransferase n=1 Tax=Mycoplasmopsis cynos TaxID=171284 RepID=UPI00296A1A80|nr:GNAT family N-acetyltransferase [Mycoplasmopsis cynos]MCU9933304.1 GNAT family N-acetyltransferase [Mycoplasmopsis cynos]WQQ12769.1 GNAT family N-acetyltransferase [Mycoplasmopsis cynos]WQQ13977.1 GNAT family N-acetyltransferase [Mycoplasmopsis cynos]
MSRIKLATLEQKDAILKTIYEADPIQYLFFISDIEQFGLNSETTKTFVYETENRFDGILMIFYNNLLIYKRDDFIFPENDIINVIEKYDIGNIIFSPNFLDTFLNMAESYKLKYKLNNEKILSLKKDDFLKENNLNNLSSKPIEKKDLEKIVNSRRKITEFADVSAQGVQLKYLNDSFEKGYYQGYILYDETNKIVVSHAGTAAKIKNVAMIGGVFTLNEHRGKGYANDCVLSLCLKLLNQNITPVLFFDNPIAGKMYYKIGFKDYSELFVTKIIK